MHDDRRLVEERLDRVLDQRIRPCIYAHRTPLTLMAWRVPGEPVPVAEALEAAFEPFEVGTQWGAPWSTVWIRAVGAVPAEWAGRRVEAVFDLGFVGDWPGGQAEALVYDLTGRPLKGIHPQNRYVPIGNPARGDEPVDLLLEAAANPDILAGGFVPTPLGDRATAGNAPLYRFAEADLAVLDETVFHLVLDLDVLRDLMRELALDDPRRHELLRTIERSLDRLDLSDVTGTAATARDALAPAFARPARASAHRISAVGHAHIDSAWLWPQRETKRKTARTFANVTALAQEYPELVFACSQAQQYAWVKDVAPDVYERIRAAVKAGSWIPAGGMWVEADGNLPGGEAMARQFVHGKRFFLDEFGVECEGVWLPDSFGYTAAFPQLARLAGMRWFLTQKLSWNQTNKFPHHTFWWEGIDGSRVFTHFPPIDTYNAVLSGAELAHAERNFAEQGAATRSLAPFGFGDGGGGPAPEHLERARRLADLEGSPRVVVESPDTFFDAAREEYPDAPVWSGELYLELHRATYTTQANTKAGNRRSEHLLREAELWSATAAVRAGFTYPYEELDRLWKAVLLHQFHDILPGSSIAWVHQEAEAVYAAVRSDLERIIRAATRAIAGDGTSMHVFNTGSHARADVVVVPAGLTDTAPAAGQPLRDAGLAVFVEVPGGGSTCGEATAAPPPVVVDDDDERTLDNGLVRVVVDPDGLITSVYDVTAERELVPAGARANLLQLHPDLPNHWDAWDIDRHYRRVQVDLIDADEVRVVDRGPLVGSIRVTRTFGESRITQTITVRAGSRRVEVHNEIDWHETEKILKAAFPIDLRADRSTAEIQFGHVHRPIHVNTSWDAARFELYAHRWVHVGEPAYGAAIVNDSTYGYDAGRTTRPDGGTTTTVRLSLVRAPRVPDPHADQGPHRMTYALVPGATIADAAQEGYALNLPLRVVAGRAGQAPGSLVETSGAGIVIEAVKLADDRSGDLVVRLYEALGDRACGTLLVSMPIERAEVVDLLERPLPDEPLVLPCADGRVPLTLRPFQILTVRLRRAADASGSPPRHGEPA